MRASSGEYVQITNPEGLASAEKQSSSTNWSTVLLICIAVICGIVLTHDYILPHTRLETPIADLETPVSGKKRQMIYFNKPEFLAKRFPPAKAAIEASRGPGNWNSPPLSIEFTTLIETMNTFEVMPDTDEMIVFGGIEYVNDLAEKEKFASFGGRSAVYAGFQRLITSLKPGATFVVQICNADTIGLIRTLAATPDVPDRVTLEHPKDWSFVCPQGIFDYDGPLQPAQIMTNLQKTRVKTAVTDVVTPGMTYTFTGDAAAKKEFESKMIEFGMGGTGVFAGQCMIKLQPRVIIPLGQTKNNILPLETNKENISPTGGGSSSSGESSPLSPTGGGGSRQSQS